MINNSDSVSKVIFDLNGKYGREAKRNMNCYLFEDLIIIGGGGTFRMVSFLLCFTNIWNGAFQTIVIIPFMNLICILQICRNVVE